MPRAGAMSRFLLAAASLLIAVGLAGCGVRGGLEPPPEARAEQERARTAAKSDPDGRPGHKGFILDGLLR